MGLLIDVLVAIGLSVPLQAETAVETIQIPIIPINGFKFILIHEILHEG